MQSSQRRRSSSPPPPTSSTVGSVLHSPILFCFLSNNKVGKRQNATLHHDPESMLFLGHQVATFCTLQKSTGTHSGKTHNDLARQALPRGYHQMVTYSAFPKRLLLPSLWTQPNPLAQRSLLPAEVQSSSCVTSAKERPNQF